MTRPAVTEIVDFIDANKDDVIDGGRLGVEPSCTTLQVAPSASYAAKHRASSARRVRNSELTPQLVGLHAQNFGVYEARKIWKSANRAGLQVGRDQTARLMRRAGLEGVLRRVKILTTTPEPEALRHPDLVNREFTAVASNQLWVTDLTYVPAWAGVVYVCFIIDAFSRAIIGWRVASTMRTETVLDAIEMARWSRGEYSKG